MIIKAVDLEVPVQPSKRESLPSQPASQPVARHGAARRPAPKRTRGVFATILRLLVWTIVLGAGSYGVYYGISTGAITKDSVSTSIARVTQWLKGSVPPPATTKRIIPVETTTALKGDMELYLKQLGSVTALYTVTLHCRVDGELYKVAFTEGQMVHQGDLLAEIDPRPFQVQLKQAEGNLLRDQASLKVAQLDMDRYMALLGSRSVTQQQVDGQKALIQQSEGAIKTDEGLIESSKLNLKYCRITAPISGRIGLRMVDPGNIVHANDLSGLAVITQLQPITVVFTIPQDDIARVQKKVNAGEKLVVDAFDREFTTKLGSGTLMAIDNQVDTTTGTVRLKAIFDNEDNMLFPNQFVNARLLVDVRHDAVIVPAAAVQRGPADSTFVYVVKADESVELRNVTLGPNEDDQSIIESGVDPGDVVVVNGVDKLQPGTKVAARDRNAPANDGKARLAEASNNGRPNNDQPHSGHGGGERNQRGNNQRDSNQRGLAERPGAEFRMSMSPSRPFILRPVATVLLMVAILLVGVVAYYQLPVSALPQVDYPTIQVLTFYPGASPDVMASSVTSPLERQFGQVPGLNQMTSTSSGGCSIITLQFMLDLNIDVAEQQVQAAINAATTFLPKDLPVPPIYSKTNPADTPILTLALTSQTLPLSKVEDFADTRLAQKISQLSGVGLVSISGGQKPAIRVQANPMALSALGLNLEDLRTALTQANVNQAKGSFDGSRESYTIGANDQLLTSEQYRKLIVAVSQRHAGRAPVLLSDVATVIDGVENQRQAAWMDETPAVIVNIQRQPGANIIEVVDRVKKLLPQFQASLPAAIKVTVSDRPHDHHPRLGRRRAVRADADHRAGGGGDFRVPAQFLGHDHSQRRGAAVADRHVRRDVPAGLQPEQPDADGADHLDRLRRRRRHRDGREHFPLYRRRAKRRWRRRSRVRARSALRSSR